MSLIALPVPSKPFYPADVLPLIVRFAEHERHAVRAVRAACCLNTSSTSPRARRDGGAQTHSRLASVNPSVQARAITRLNPLASAISLSELKGISLHLSLSCAALKRS
jgi:hypothetical protein